MKNLFFLFAFAALFTSCDDEMTDPLRELDEAYIREIIEHRKVDALEMCCSDCPCDQEMGVGKDYDFPGNNQLRIRHDHYDLDRVFSYKIENFQDGFNKEVRMILFME